MIASLFLILQASTPQPSPLSSEAVTSTRAFIECLHTRPMQAQAVRLERSGASTADFFEAAESSCAQEYSDARGKLTVSFQDRYSGSPGKDPQKAATDLLILVVDKEWREIRIEIAKQRAGKSN